MYIYIYIHIYIDIHIYIYVSLCVCVCVCVYVCVCVCVLTIKGGVDVSGFPSLVNTRHRITVIFDTRKTLYLKIPSAKLLKTYLKENDNIYFVVI